MSLDWTDEGIELDEARARVDKTKNRYNVMEGEFVKINRSYYHVPYREAVFPMAHNLIIQLELGTMPNAFIVKSIDHETGECLLQEFTTGLELYCEYPFLMPSNDYGVFSMV